MDSEQQRTNRNIQLAAKLSVTDSIGVSNKEGSPREQWSGEGVDIVECSLGLARSSGFGQAEENI